MIRFLPQSSRGVERFHRTHRLVSDQPVRPYVRTKFDHCAWEAKEAWEVVALEERMVARLLRLCAGYLDVTLRPFFRDGYDLNLYGPREYSGHLISVDGMSCAVEFQDGRMRLYVTGLPRDWTGPKDVVVPISKRGKRAADIRAKFLQAMREMDAVRAHLHVVEEWKRLLAPLWFRDLSVSIGGESADLTLRVSVRREDADKIAHLQAATYAITSPLPGYVRGGRVPFQPIHDASTTHLAKKTI